MTITMTRFGVAAGACVRRPIAAADAFLTSIDQPMTDEDVRRMEVAFCTLGMVFLVLDLGLCAWAVLA